MSRPEPREVTLLVDESGATRFLHDDQLIRVRARLGAFLLQRVSHVEPDRQGNWHADLSPVLGPVLGPFATRQEALAAEKDWLEAQGLPAPPPLAAAARPQPAARTESLEPSDVFDTLYGV